jgi:hypothetical protein
VDGDRTPRQLLEPQGLSAYSPVFSPDGRWIAYAGAPSGGPPNLFLQPFPATGSKYQLTTNVGAAPAWSPDGKQLFYQTGPVSSGRLFVIDVRTTPTVTAGERGVIEFRGLIAQNPNFRNYDVTPDGKQFVIVVGGAENFADSINVVLNWTEELKQQVPAR